MRRVEVAVVGAGPSGIAAALAARSAGSQVVLIDEQSEIGGQLRYRRQATSELHQAGLCPADSLPALAQTLFVSGIELLTATTVWGAFAPTTIETAAGDKADSFSCSAIVLATGSTDTPCAFPGWTLPGVWSERGLQILINRHGVLPGMRTCIVGNDDRVDELKSDIEAAGGDVVAHVPDAHTSQMQAFGKGALSSISTNDWSGEADVIVIAAGRQPDAQLALMLECQAEVQPMPWAFQPIVDRFMQTSIDNVFSVGDCLGIVDASQAWRQGTVGGFAAALATGRACVAELDDARAHLPRPERVDGTARFAQPWRSESRRGAIL